MSVNGTNIYAGQSPRGLYLSTNNGNSWTSINNESVYQVTTSIHLDGINLLVGTNGVGAYLSTDEGNVWNESFNGMSCNSIRTFLLIVILYLRVFFIRPFPLHINRSW
ncbi:MAG: hypothetical protein IPL09_02135 [Bacteroidetes bacterium]|nr:hypothetical protein [Bacteroidota bacterium]